MLPAFVELGISSFSVAPGCAAELKAAIRNYHAGDGTSFVA
jgi:phosphoenolpyruvate-protein kinase (PTS system EI component)